MYKSRGRAGVAPYYDNSFITLRRVTLRRGLVVVIYLSHPAIGREVGSGIDRLGMCLFFFFFCSGIPSMSLGAASFYLDGPSLV